MTLRENVTRAIRKARQSENFCSLCDKPYKHLIHCSCAEMADAALAAIEEARPTDDVRTFARWLLVEMHFPTTGTFGEAVDYVAHELQKFMEARANSR